MWAALMVAIAIAAVALLIIYPDLMVLYAGVLSASVCWYGVYILLCDKYEEKASKSALAKNDPV